MMESGYIKLYRSLLKWEWYDDINTKVVFLHLLLTASIEDSKWHGIIIKRGCRVSSYAKLSEEIGISVKQVRTAISHLETTGEVARQKNAKYTVFAIKNYDLYQQTASKTASNGQGGGKVRASNGQQYKKIKEDKEDKEDIISTENRTDYDEILSLYREICVSYPKVKSLSDARKKAIRARLRTYSIDDFKTVFQNAENSSFLKGQNNRNWSATFDWMIRDANFAKILDGNYNGDNKPKATESEKADAYKSFIYNIDE